MRDHLLKLFKPLADQLAKDLADVAARRIEAELERVKEAFEVAASSYASEPDLLTAALGPELAMMLMPPREAMSSGAAHKFPVKGKETSDVPARDAGVESKSTSPSPVPEADSKRGAPRQSGNGGSSSGGKVICSKCGYVGGNARGCGKPSGHPTQQKSTSVAIVDAVSETVGEASPDRVPAPPSLSTKAKFGTLGVEPTKAKFGTLGVEPPKVRTPVTHTREIIVATDGARRVEILSESEFHTRGAPPRAPSPAAIEIAKRRAAERDAREEQPERPRRQAAEPAAVDENDNADERWSPSRIAEEREIAENRKHEGTLPAPRSTFRVTQRDHDVSDVEELDFGGQVDG